MSKKQIAVIGFGNWGKNHARVLHELGCLSGIYDMHLDINNYKNSKYNFFSNIDELISGSDAAIIATPVMTHYEIAKKLLPFIDLLIEKPLTVSTKECEDLLKLSKKYNKILMVGHQLQFHPAVKKMKNLIKDGLIGDIKWVYSNRLNMGKIRLEENVMWSFAPHDISLILSLIESKIQTINIQGTKILNKDLEDATLTSFEFKNGVKGHVFVSWFHPFKEQRFVVVGSKGTLVFSDTEDKNKLIMYKTKINNLNFEITNSKTKSIKYEFKEPLKEQSKYFIKACENRTFEINNAKHAYSVIKFLEESSKLLAK